MKCTQSFIHEAYVFYIDQKNGFDFHKNDKIRRYITEEAVICWPNTK